jgi:hypothetical protein
MKTSKQPNFTLEEMQFWFSYDPETGHIMRIRGAKAGEIVTNKTKDGYIILTFFYRKIYGHQLAWWFSNGAWPTTNLDHINCDKSDNRIANLRETTPRLNCMNQNARRDNKTGLKGVIKKGNKFRAHITYNYQKRWLGYFDSPEEAHEAYKRAAIEIAGDHARW